MSDRYKIPSEPLWYKDAVIYEVHVKTFFDSNDDGIGDFQGLIGKLDYLHDLGITAIWLLPFYPSPLKDDGYDISDYGTVRQEYGTLGDFKEFLREAHKRGIRVITELVINHTSDQHKWFQRARRAKAGSSQRDYYVWSDTPEKYKDARIIFSDFEKSNWAWDQVAGAYYWHRFYSHQPDLNFDNPQVRNQIFRILDFWLGMGVDGLRLDAIPYLYEREGTNCENLPETHEFLREMRAHIDGKYEDRVLIAEANQWPEDASAYFGKGDECHMAFHFPVMPRLFMGVQMEDRFPIINMIEQSMDIPESCQWTMFLRNHDELTLEMVTDDERDYMYRAYAQDPKARINLGIRRRLAPLMENNRRKIELMNFLLLSLPGTPVLYYGDEIGMGDNYYLGDRDGVRTPMQWNPDRNAGFSRSNPQKLFLPVVIDLQYHYTAVNVESQLSNPSSLLWFTRNLISMRNRFKALGRGGIEFVPANNNHVLSFVRKYEDEYILVVANLSRFSQVAQLSLKEYAGWLAEEVFGGNKFPSVTEQPYVLSLGPFNTYWVTLHKEDKLATLPAAQMPRLVFDAPWERITKKELFAQLDGILPGYLKKCRWFGGKGKPVRSVSIIDHIAASYSKTASLLLLLEVIYVGSQKERYLLPISYAKQPQALDIAQKEPQSVICQAMLGEEDGIIYDGAYDEQLRSDLLRVIIHRQKIRSRGCSLSSIRSSKFRSSKGAAYQSIVLKGEQSNTAFVYDKTFFLKLYRRLEGGINPDAEISRYLTEYTDFVNFPSYIGKLEWQCGDSESLSVGLLLEYVENESDGWSYTLDSVNRYLSNAVAQKDKLIDLIKPRSIYEIDPKNIPQSLLDLITPVFLEMISLLARRTAELHLALASLDQDQATVPEPFSLFYQKSIYQSMQTMTLEVFSQIQSNLSRLDDETAKQVQEIIDAKQEILNRFKNITTRKISAKKIRIHGDYHLGQILYTGKDFVIIDFEGEPARPLSQRRLKRSALRDVAGMIRSFHYAAHGALILKPVVQSIDPQELKNLADMWYYYVSAVFIDSYLQTAGDGQFVPGNKKDFEMLLSNFLLEKAIYELGYEMNNRPDWLAIPLRGVQQLLKLKS